MYRRINKRNGLLTKQECQLWEASLRKILMNKRKWDFWGKGFWKEWCYIEKVYPKSKSEKTGYWWRVWFKKFLIKELQQQEEIKIARVEQSLGLTEKRLKTLNDALKGVDDKIEEIKVNKDKISKNLQREWDEIEVEIQAIENSSAQIQKERSEFNNNIKSTSAEEGKIKAEILDTKEVIMDNQLKINEVSRKLQQKEEYISEVMLVLKHHGKELEKDVKKSKKEHKKRKNSHLVESKRLTLDNETVQKAHQAVDIYQNRETHIDEQSTNANNRRISTKVTKELIGELIARHNRENTDTSRLGASWSNNKCIIF